MYCMKQMSPQVYTLFIPMFPVIKKNNINKKSVRFSNDNEIYIIPPRLPNPPISHKMKR